MHRHSRVESHETVREAPGCWLDLASNTCVQLGRAACHAVQDQAPFVGSSYFRCPQRQTQLPRTPIAYRRATFTVATRYTTDIHVVIYKLHTCIPDWGIIYSNEKPRLKGTYTAEVSRIPHIHIPSARSTYINREPALRLADFHIHTPVRLDYVHKQGSGTTTLEDQHNRR